MEDTYRLPEGSIPYVLYQRTQYYPVHPIHLALVAVGFVKPLYKWSVDMRTRFFSKTIERMFWEDMQKEYESIRAYLPESCENFLDIGAGIAGLDAIISRHYEHKTHVHILDKTAINDVVYYRFNPRGAYYNSLELSRATLQINGVAPDHVHLIEANEKNEINTSTQFDLVCSFISWGFHYPVATYRDRVYDLLKTGGKLIVDVRKNSGGFEELQQRFAQVSIIQDVEKYQRVMCIK